MIARNNESRRTYRWLPPEDSNGGSGSLIYTPYSDWWLRSLVNPAAGPPADCATFPAAFRSGFVRPEAGGSELPTNHPAEIAPIRQGTGCPDCSTIGPAPPIAQSHRARKGDVIIGIIDDEIAIANTRFLKRDGDGRPIPRVTRFWNQNAKCPGTNSGLPFGRAWDETELAKLFRRHRVASGYPDETPIYRELEMDRVLIGKDGHGTHVMDLATGYDFDSDVVNELGETGRQMSGSRPIIAVELARYATRETSGAYMAAYVTYAMEYIIRQAIAMQPDKDSDRVPLVMNFSYGIIAGGHNGTNRLEEWIDQAIETVRNEHGIPVAVTLPAGNTLQSRTHGRLRLNDIKSGTTAEFVLRLQPGNKEASFVEIWLPPQTDADEEAGPSLEVNVKPPFCAQFVPAGNQPDFSQGVALEDPAGRRCAKLYFERVKRTNDDGTGMTWQKATLAFCPTLFEQAGSDASFHEVDNTAVAGNWTVSVNCTQREDARHNAEAAQIWVQRGDTPFGFDPRGRQSYLVDPEYPTHDPKGRLIDSQNECPDTGYVRRNGTLNAICTGKNPIRVGSYRYANHVRAHSSNPFTGDRMASIFSSAANPDASHEPFQSVDAGAATEISHALSGIRASGIGSGSTARFPGTSSAAPQLARYIAKRLGAGSWPPAGQTIRQALRRAATSDPIFMRSPQEDRTGAGLLGPFGRNAR